MPAFHVEGAQGPVYAPVRAHIKKDLWQYLPNKFLNCALTSCFADERLLESQDVKKQFTGINCDYHCFLVSDDSARKHPAIPASPIGREIKDSLPTVLFNLLINVYGERVEDLFFLNSHQ